MRDIRGVSYILGPTFPEIVTIWVRDVENLFTRSKHRKYDNKTESLTAN